MLKKVTILALLAILVVAGCNPQEDPPGDPDNPIVTIIMENGGNIEIELFPEEAPNTVRNFIELVQAGYYDGLSFHQVRDYIQGGCPLGTGKGDPGYFIAGEFINNGFENNLSHEKGVISMARLPDDYDSAGSQFFITMTDRPDLDGDYAAFGIIISGFDVVEEIAGMENDEFGNPIEPQRIATVTVETFGRVYEPAEKIGR